MKFPGIELDATQMSLIDLLESLDISSSQSFMYKLIKKFSRSPKAKNNIYLYGGVGRGKTMIATAFYNKQKVPKAYFHYQDFMRDIHSQMHSYQGYSGAVSYVAEDIARKYKFLVIDEFEIHDIADAMIVYNLFYHLLNAGMHFLITTNIDPDNLYKNGLQRESFLPFIDLLKEEFQIFPLDGKHDYRLDNIPSEKRMFYPNDKHVQKQIDKIEKDLIGDHKTKDENLKFFGRKIHFKRVYHDILFTDFDELCCKPHSAADFVEIAKHFTIIVMENVPYIAKDDTDLAIRFINFIDNVYFHKVLLFISLADEPEKIYPIGKRSGEFQRTISRLYEIDSDKYFKNSKHQ